MIFCPTYIFPGESRFRRLSPFLYRPRLLEMTPKALSF